MKETIFFFNADYIHKKCLKYTNFKILILRMWFIYQQKGCTRKIHRLQKSIYQQWRIITECYPIHFHLKQFLLSKCPSNLYLKWEMLIITTQKKVIRNSSNSEFGSMINIQQLCKSNTVLRIILKILRIIQIVLFYISVYHHVIKIF